MNKKEVTVLFCDIRNFTQISDSLNPKQVKSILDEYLRLIRDAVNNHSGELNKFLGDSALVVFEKEESHGLNAVKAALELKKSFIELKKSLDEKTNEYLNLGIGVHTGPVMMGDIGGDQAENVIVGSTVNLTARLQTYSENNNIIATETSVADFAETLELRKVDDAFIKDFNTRIPLVEVLRLK